MYRRLVTLVLILMLASLLGGLSGCVYYNTFYNAKKEFNAAEKVRKQSGSATKSSYNIAIEKALKVIESHPGSKYYDDALFVVSVSYYYTEQYFKAERRLRELLANYPESKFSREATLYLAKSRLKLGEQADAIDVFEEVYEGDYSKEYKAEASLELGRYYLDQREFDIARSYFLAVRDSLGDDKQRLQAQRYVADAYFESFKFADALGAYLQILGMDPDKGEKYHCLYNAALCSYRLQRINDGIDYLQELAKDQLYFDSLGALQLNMALGYEYAEELAQAEGTYLDVATTSVNNRWQGEAYYRLGLIYQYDYDDLNQAKEFYDKSTRAYTAGESGRDALARSSDIATLQAINKRKQDTTSVANDSLATPQEIQAEIDENSYMHVQLAELYWFQLNKPDSAVLELREMIDLYPTSRFAPRAMAALATMYRDYLADTLGADSILNEALVQYPRSDYRPVLLAQLGQDDSGLVGGYPAYYYHKAEDFFVDHQDIDSALYYYQYVTDSFPDSDYGLQARFNIIWIYENYRSPGDSTVLLAYQEIVDSFPGTPQATEAQRRLQVQRREMPVQIAEVSPSARPSDTARVNDDDFERKGDVIVAKPIQDTEEDTWHDPLEKIYVGPRGEPLILLEAEPTETREEFEYPAEASGVEGRAFQLYFHILLDFTGRVKEFVLKAPGPHDEINRRAERTINSMTFDPLEVNKQLTQKAESLTLPEEQQDPNGRWFVYKFVVQKPDWMQ